MISNSTTHTIRSLALPVLVLVGAGSAMAESSPYYLGTSLGLTRISNVYRLSSSLPTNDDWVSTGSLLGGIDQRLGRQRVFGNASLNSNRYRHNTLLNNTSYQLDGGLDWSAFERVSGSLTAGGSKSLAEFNPGGDRPSLTIKNIQTVKQAEAKLRYGLAGQFSIEGKAGHFSSHYSAAEYLPYNYGQYDAALGLNYRPSPALNAGVYARHTRGNYPNYRVIAGNFVSDQIRRNDLDLTTSWQPTGHSSLTARLSFGRANHSDATSASFRGATGSVAWQWQALPRLSVNTLVARDTGLDSTPIVGSTQGTEIDYNRVTTRARLGADYAITAKVSLSASYARSARDSRNSFGQNSVSGSDTLTAWRLGMSWNLARNGLLSCQYTQDERSLGQSQPISPYTLPFTAHSFGCTGQYMLR